MNDKITIHIKGDITEGYSIYDEVNVPIKPVVTLLSIFEYIERNIASCTHYEQIQTVVVMIDRFKEIFGDDNAVRVLNEKLSKKGNELL